MSNMIDFYKTLGPNTRRIIKSALTVSFILVFLGVFSNYAYFLPCQYEFLLISDQLLITSRTFLVIGFVGALVFNYLEKR
ncbi:MAG: hypothetical protein ACI4VW_08650 [Acutalibacteraceae bacterium]